MLPSLRSFLTTVIQRERFENALDEEMRFHLSAQTEDLVRTGVPAREAALRTQVLFGSIATLKADCRHARGLWVIDQIERTMTTIRMGLVHARQDPAVRQSARPQHVVGNSRHREQVPH